MIRSVLVHFPNTRFIRRFANRSGKVYRFIPTPVKSFVVSKESLPPQTKINTSTAEVLEKVSLVGIESEEVVRILEEAIAFADQIFLVDTAKVKPLVTVLEDESLCLREDIVEADVTRTELLSQSKCTQENYFITPAGNIQFVPTKKFFELPDLQKASVKE